MRGNDTARPTMTVGSVIQGALRRDRVVVVVCLLAVIALSWSYLLSGAGMGHMDHMTMTVSMPWTPHDTLVVLVMWLVMMAAMMLPSAAPIVLLMATISRRQSERGQPAAASGAFALGYVTVWGVFSIAAVALQFALDRAALLSPAMQTTSAVLAGAVLIGAGLYQWTGLKQACLRRCRSPLEFITTSWRPGARGAFVMGLHHGAFCVGCCWLIMLLLFLGGVMNFAWIGGIALFVLIEKVLPAGDWIGRAAGVLLVVWGAATLVAAVGV